VFLVDEMKLGNHKMIVVNQVDGVDTNGGRVQVSLLKEKHPSKHLPFVKEQRVRMWSQCIVSNANRVLVGTREGKRLNAIKMYEVDDFVRAIELDESIGACFEFQNRLLTWIKLHLPVSC
jgi:hypothetical protein